MTTGIKNLQDKLESVDNRIVDLENDKNKLISIQDHLVSMFSQYKDFLAINITTSEGFLEFIESTRLPFKETLSLFASAENAGRLANVIGIALNDISKRLKVVNDELAGLYEQFSTVDKNLNWELVRKDFLDNVWSQKSEDTFLREGKLLKRNQDLLHSMMSKKRQDDGVVYGKATAAK